MLLRSLLFFSVIIPYSYKLRYDFITSQQIPGSMPVHLRLLLFITCSFFSISNLVSQEVNWRLMGENKDATFYEVQKDFYDYWKDKTPGKGQGYGVFKRWENKMAPRVYPSGNLTQTRSLYSNYTKWSKSYEATERSPKGNWVELGPLSKPSGYDAGVGRVDFVRFNPTNPNILYVSTPDGGLWQTTNAMDDPPTWTTYNDFLDVIGCSDLVIAPDGVTMYLATGSWESDKRSIGIFKSIDGGKSWNTTGLTWALTDNYKIRRLIMDPTNPLIMMAATDGGVWRTTDGWATSVVNPVPTIDGNYNVQDLKFKPSDPMTVYASGKNGGAGEVFWKSTDNGATWANAGSGLPAESAVSRIILGVTNSAGGSGTVYALAGNGSGGYLGTYRSTDSGTNFSTQSTTPNILNTNSPPTGADGQAGHDLAIAVSPVDANLLTIGGINQYRSTDGGVTWNILTYWYGTDPFTTGGTPGIAPYLHADVQSIEYSPTNSTTLYATCDGSISRSFDNGTTWKDLSNNLSIAQMTEIALSASEPTLMVTGLQDIGNLKNTNGVWTYVGGGDGESAFIDYSDNLNIVTSDPNGQHSYSWNGGLDRESLEGNGLPAGTEFFSPIKQDPTVSTTCYAGGRPDLYRCLNYQNTPNHAWSSIGSPTGTGSVLNFVVAPSNNQIIYTIKGDAVSKTIDGGSNWNDVTGTLPVMDTQIKNIAISNTNPNKVWVVFSGYDAGNKVFRTTDGGTTWTNVHSSTLPNIPINTIVYRNDSSNDEVYIGADIGVYVVDNTMSSWVPFNTGIPNCTVNDLEIYYPTGRLRAATYGRGAWESNLYTGANATLVNIKVFLEGPFNSTLGKMSDDLRSNSLLPTTDPYPSFGFTHMNGEIEGTNSAILIKSDANDAIVDWVYVELRDKITPATVLYTRAALVQRDGDVVDMDGVSALHFSNAPADNYYIAVRHHNHLGFRSMSSIALSSTAATVNFTNNSIPTFGVMALKELSTGVFGMYSGDANRDGNVNSFDLNTNWRIQNGGTYDYINSTADFDLNGAINAVDKNAHWRLNNSRVAQLD